MSSWVSYRAIRCLACFFISIPLVAGCVLFSDRFTALEDSLIAQQPAAAMAALEKRKTPRRDRVLYFLDKGMLLQMQGEYVASNESFAQAKALMKKLSAFSAREQVSSLLINDMTRAYAGEDYERLLVHVYMALNYLALRRLDDARVEALQIDETLRELNTDHNTIVGSVFARYLAGMIFEESRDYSDAMIAYRKAYEGYQSTHTAIPSALKYDLLRLSERVGLAQENIRYQRLFSIKKWLSIGELNRQGEIIFVLHDGLAPIKREQSLTVSNPRDGRLIRFAAPYYEERPNPLAYAEVNAMGVRARADVVEDVTKIAMSSLEAQMPAITARAMARMAMKDRTVREKKKKNDPLPSFAFNVAGVVTERADTRSWLTLPANIRIARLPLQPGQYDLSVAMKGRYGALIDAHVFSDVEVKVGRKTYVSLHWITEQHAIIRRRHR